MSRVDDLRSDYDMLGRAMTNEFDGAKLAALARERRIVGELLEQLEKPEGASVADELDEQRRKRAGDSGSTRGRRQSG